LSDLELRGLTKKFGGFKAVDHVTLKVESGEFLSLIGPSGCGKTTTLRMIAGLSEPDGGSIFIKNEVVNEKPVHKRNIGMVFQSYALFPHMTVFDNIAFGLRMKKFNRTAIKQKVDDALHLVQLPHLRDRYPKQISGGQQQRVALARAIVTEPAVLLLDEPMSNLDAKLREQMRVDLKQLQQKLGITTIYVTHDQIEAFTMSDQVVLMHAGRIEQIGTPLDVYEMPATVFAANFIGHSNIFRSKFVPDDYGAGSYVVTEKGLKIKVAPRAAFESDESLCLAIRPERIRLLESGRDAKLENRLAGKIEFIAYLGASTQYQVSAESGDIFIVEEQNIRGYQTRKKGGSIFLEWSMHDCLLTPMPPPQGPADREL
jgi:spermidine/putrescine ABC transporter ATP-binding subunit